MCKKCLLISVVLLLGASVASAKTVAYWRFDDMYNPPIDFSEGLASEVAAGNALPDSDGRSVYRKAVHDWSGNGNDLTTWEHAWAGHNWSSDGPCAQVPGPGIENQLSIVNAGNYPAAFTWSEQSSPSGTDLETWTPSAWTIEASFKANDLWAYHTIVGRDGFNVSDEHAMKAPVYFSVRPNGVVAIEFSTLDRQTYQANSAQGLVTTGQWYHMVAVSDGETLSLYLNNVLVAQTAGMTGDTRIGIGEGAGGDNYAGTWSVGRGMWNAGHGDRWIGLIDEVRLSDTALDPCRFLMVPEPATILILGLGGLTLLRRRG
jgi:hypothetical protein